MLRRPNPLLNRLLTFKHSKIVITNEEANVLLSLDATVLGRGLAGWDCHPRRHVPLCRNYTSTYTAKNSKDSLETKNKNESASPSHANTNDKKQSQPTSATNDSSVETTSTSSSQKTKDEEDGVLLNQVADYLSSDKFHDSVLDRLNRIQDQARDIFLPEYIKTRPKWEERRSPNMDANWWLWNILLAMSPGIIILCVCEFFRADMEEYELRTEIFRKQKALGENFVPTPEEIECLEKFERLVKIEEKKGRSWWSDITMSKIVSDLLERLQLEHVYETFQVTVLGKVINAKEDGIKSKKKESSLPDTSQLNSSESMNHQRRNSPMLSHRFGNNSSIKPRMSEGKAGKANEIENIDSTKSSNTTSPSINQNDSNVSVDFSETSIILNDILMRVKAVEDQLKNRDDGELSKNESYEAKKQHSSTKKAISRLYSTLTRKMGNSVVEEVEEDDKSPNIAPQHLSQKRSKDFDNDIETNIDLSNSRPKSWWNLRKSNDK